jgi:hypothetical protein
MIRIAFLGAIVVLLLGACTEMGGWDTLSELRARGPWRYRVPLRVASSGSGEIITDLPIRVTLGPNDLDQDTLNADATNLGFYAAPYENGAQPLSHEIARLEPDGSSEFWVRLPTLPRSGSSTIWLYYGGDGVTVKERSSDVWRAGYVTVLHFEEPEPPFEDSTRYGVHATVPPVSEGATAPHSADGLAGAGLRYLEDTDKIRLAADSAVSTMAPVSLSMWISAQSDRTARLFSKGDWYVAYSQSTGRIQVRFQHGTTDVFGEWNAPLPPDSWQGITVNWDGGLNASGLDLFTNGALVTSSVIAQSGEGTQDDDSSRPLGIGNYEFSSGSGAPDAVIDEVRIARSDRSTGWIDAEHRSVTGQLVTVGSVEELW